MAERCLRLSIEGRVQGVGFREAMLRQARELGVNGWVRNRRDGRVEAEVSGASDAVERLLAWCAHGPALARVDAVRAEPAEGVHEGFERRPTTA